MYEQIFSTTQLMKVKIYNNLKMEMLEKGTVYLNNIYINYHNIFEEHCSSNNIFNTSLFYKSKINTLAANTVIV